MTTKPLLRHAMFRAVWVGVLLMMSLMAVGAFAPAAYAHADYERSLPAADSVISTSPTIVEVWFTQELFRREGANRLEVIGPGGSQVDLSDSRIDDDDRTHVLVSLQPDLPAGIYTVRWFNVSLEDGHEEEGEFVFTIDPSAPTGAVESTAAPTETADSVATESPEPTEVPVAPTPTSTPANGIGCFGGLILLPFLMGSVGWVRYSHNKKRIGR